MHYPRIADGKLDQLGAELPAIADPRAPRFLLTGSAAPKLPPTHTGAEL